MKLLRGRYLCIAATVGVCLCQPASAASVTIAPSKGNTLYQSSTGTLSNGRGQYFFCGLTAASQMRRGLIHFDIAANVPAGSRIQSANLTLHMSRTIGRAITISLHRSVSDFGEGNSAATGNEGQGAPAAPGDATWHHSFYDTRLWTTPGGDYDAPSSSSLLVANEGFNTWPSTAAVVSEVQSWLDSPQTNFGWVLVSDDEVTALTAKRFDSRWNNALTQRPTLEVVFAPPDVDGGSGDGGFGDGGAGDAGNPDAGPTDAGVDAGPPDSGSGNGDPLQPAAHSGGCQSAPGPVLALMAAAMLGVFLARRRALAQR